MPSLLSPNCHPAGATPRRPGPGVAHLDAAGLECGKKAFQVIDSVLNLDLTHQAASRSQAWLALQR